MNMGAAAEQQPASAEVGRDAVFQVLLFASLKDAAGESVMVRLSGALTTGQLLRACGEQHPALAPWLPHVKVAVNCEYAMGDQAINPGDEIALIPPVAGG